MAFSSSATNRKDVDGQLQRFNADGSFDSAFGAGGRVTTANPSGSAGFIAVLAQPDGKILAAGEGNTPTQNELFLARYLR